MFFFKRYARKYEHYKFVLHHLIEDIGVNTPDRAEM